MRRACGTISWGSKDIFTTRIFLMLELAGKGELYKRLRNLEGFS
jgi:hypothetical protein